MESISFSGQCHCGNIIYRVDGTVERFSYCECRGCQKASGTLKVPFVSIKASAFILTHGELRMYRGYSDAKCDQYGVWYFCPKCGSHVYWKGNSGDEIDLFAGSLDDLSLLKLDG